VGARFSRRRSSVDLRLVPTDMLHLFAEAAWSAQLICACKIFRRLQVQLRIVRLLAFIRALIGELSSRPTRGNIERARRLTAD
jgi:hypothetical protein